MVYMHPQHRESVRERDRSDDRRENTDLLLFFYHLWSDPEHSSVVATRHTRSAEEQALEVFVGWAEPDWAEWHERPWFTEDEARTFMDQEYSLVRRVVEGYLVHRLEWLDFRLLNYNLIVGPRRKGTELRQAIALVDGDGRRAKPEYWDGAIIWPPYNPVEALLESTGMTRKSLDREGGLPGGTSGRLVRGEPAKIPSQLLSLVVSRIGGSGITKEQLQTTYEMWRSGVNLHRLHLPSAIPGYLSERYVSPILISLAVQLSEACVQLLQACPSMGRCARPGCGRVFATRARGHGKRYCCTGCQKTGWESGPS